MAKAKEEKAEQAALSEHTFERIAAELVEKLRREGKAETTLSKKQWLLDMANAEFGSQPITAITPAMILKALKAVEAKGKIRDGQAIALHCRPGVSLCHRIGAGRNRSDACPARRADRAESLSHGGGHRLAAIR